MSEIVPLQIASSVTVLSIISSNTNSQFLRKKKIENTPSGRFKPF